MKFKVRYASVLTDEEDSVEFDINTLEELMHLYNIIEKSTEIRKTEFGFAGIIIYKDSESESWHIIGYDDTVEY
jgi:AMMECR1 domain-containing protein